MESLLIKIRRFEASLEKSHIARSLLAHDEYQGQLGRILTLNFQIKVSYKGENGPFYGFSAMMTGC